MEYEQYEDLTLLSRATRKRSVADFVERLTMDYFVTPSNRTAPSSALDANVLWPALDQLVPDLAAQVGAICHYLDVIDKQHIPTSYRKPLEKPLIVPALVGYILSVVVSQATGVRVPTRTLDAWFAMSMKGSDSRGVLSGPEWMSAIQRIDNATIKKWRSAGRAVLGRAPRELFRSLLGEPPVSQFGEAKRIVRTVHDNLHAEPQHFLARVWLALMTQLCCGVYVRKVVHIPADAPLLLDKTLDATVPLLTAFEASLRDQPAELQLEVFTSTSTELAIACVTACAIKILGDFFGSETATAEMLTKSSTLLAKLHADFSAYLRLTAVLSSRDEKLLDTASALLSRRPRQIASVRLSFELFGASHVKLTSQSAIPLCGRSLRRGVVQYQPLHGADRLPRSTVVSCSLVRHPASLKRFRDAVLLTHTISKNLLSDEDGPVNGSRATVFADCRLNADDSIKSPSTGDVDLDSRASAYILSEKEKAAREALMQASHGSVHMAPRH